MKAIEQRTERAARWIYGGLWRFLVDWMKVPHEPPQLPAEPGQFHTSFQPAEAYLQYLKLFFWVGLTLFDGLLAFILIAIFIASPLAGAIVLLPMLVVMILPDIIAYIALHLRYDTTWYVMTDRSLRIRRGVWIIHEVTITFENVQNVKVSQGPIQQTFGIANVVVETAGGGSTPKQGQATPMHVGIIEGITNAPEIRDLILSRLKQSRTAGLGDELHAGRSYGTAWSAAQVDVLREIRAEIRQLTAAG